MKIKLSEMLEKVEQTIEYTKIKDASINKELYDDMPTEVIESLLYLVHNICPETNEICSDMYAYMKLDAKYKLAINSIAIFKHYEYKKACGLLASMIVKMKITELSEDN